VPSPAEASRGPGTGGRWLLAALIVVAVAVAVPIGATEVVIASRIGHLRLPVGQPPPLPALPDASQSGIELAATSRGFRCMTLQSVDFGFPVPTVRVCRRMTGGEILTVQTIGSDPSHVSLVSANVVGLRPGDEAATLALFQDSAWLSTNFDQAGTTETVVDGVTLRLTGSGSRRALILQPASPPF
jgi:hypothetical protein